MWSWKGNLLGVWAELEWCGGLVIKICCIHEWNSQGINTDIKNLKACKCQISINVWYHCVVSNFFLIVAESKIRGEACKTALQSCAGSVWQTVFERTWGLLEYGKVSLISSFDILWENSGSMRYIPPWWERSSKSVVYILQVKESLSCLSCRNEGQIKNRRHSESKSEYLLNFICKMGMYYILKQRCNKNPNFGEF